MHSICKTSAKVSQTLQCIQNCLDKSIHMQLIIHTFYPVFRIACRNQKVKRFDHSIKEMHQNFLFQTKSSWSQTEQLVIVCNTLIRQITVCCCIKFPPCEWLTQLYIIKNYQLYINENPSNPTYLSGINSNMLLFEFCRWVEKCDTCLDIFPTCFKHFKTTRFLEMYSKILLIIILLMSNREQCHWISILKIYTRLDLWKLMQYWLHF